MEKSIHLRRPRLAMMLANVALAIVLALGMSPATKAMAEPSEAGSVELEAKISATVNGGSMTSGKEFTFGLFDTDNEGSKTGEAISTVKVKAGETAVLGKGVAYSQDDAGSYTYVISQLDDLGEGWTKAADQKITVKVSKNDDDAMTADVDYGEGKTAAAFDVKYAAEGELEAKISATVNGGSITPGKEFTFGLFETNSSGAKTGNAIATATVKAGQTAVLDGVFYDQDNAGETITYMISQLDDLGEGWTKAADQKITVKVSDNGDGTMTADVNYGEGKTAACFDIKYQEPKTSKASEGDASSEAPATKTAKASAKTSDPFAGMVAICAGAVFAAGAAALGARRMRKSNR